MVVNSDVVNDRRGRGGRSKSLIMGSTQKALFGEFQLKVFDLNKEYLLFQISRKAFNRYRLVF